MRSSADAATGRSLRSASFVPGPSGRPVFGTNSDNRQLFDDVLTEVLLPTGRPVVKTATYGTCPWLPKERRLARKPDDRWLPWVRWHQVPQIAEKMEIDAVARTQTPPVVWWPAAVPMLGSDPLLNSGALNAPAGP